MGNFKKSSKGKDKGSGLPTLRFYNGDYRNGQPSNAEEFFRAFEQYFVSEYGTAAKCLEEMKYNTPVLISQSELQELQDLDIPTKLRNSLVSKTMETRLKSRRDYEEVYTKMVADLLMHSELHVQQMLKRQPEWEKISDGDPVLFKQVAVRELNCAGFSSTVAQKAKAREEWAVLKRGDMTFANFQRHVTHMCEHLKYLGVLTEDNEAEFAFDIVRKMGSTHAQLVCDIENSQRAAPTTIMEAWSIVATYKSVSKEAGTGAAASIVMAITTKKRKTSGESSEKTAKRRKVEKAGASKTDKTSDKKTSGENKEVRCFNCGKKGHVRNDCPEIKCYKCKGFGHVAKVCKMNNSNEDVEYLAGVLSARSRVTGAAADEDASLRCHEGKLEGAVVDSGEGQHAAGGEEGVNTDRRIVAGEREPHVTDPTHSLVYRIESKNKRSSRRSNLSANDCRELEIEAGIDTQAGIHLVKDRALLRDLVQADESIVVEGLTGRTTLSEYGKCGPFERVWFHPDGPVNLISFGLAKEQGANISYDEYHDEHCVKLNGYKFHFSRRPGLNVYTASFERIAAENADNIEEKLERVLAAFDTVESTKRVYTEREIKGADKAKDLFAAMAYPSIKNLVLLLRRGKIRNCDVTVRDVFNCVDIYGKDLAFIRGRTKRIARPAPSTEPSVPLGDENVDLFIDLLFVKRVAFIISVSTPINFVMVNYVNSKKASVLKAALMKHKAKYVRQGFKVNHLFCDGESGIASIASELELDKWKPEFSGPETHVGKVEVAIQLLKAMARSVVSVLPYDLPNSLLVWLMYYVASRSNFVPTSTIHGVITPREYLLGRQLDYARDLALKFGDYVEVPQKTTNTLRDRTRPGIALVSTGNVYGSWKVYYLDKMSIGTMDTWEKRPMSTEVINKLNRLAASEKGKVEIDMLFEMGKHGRVVGDMAEEEFDEKFMTPSNGARTDKPIEHTEEGDYDPESMEAPEQAVTPDVPESSYRSENAEAAADAGPLTGVETEVPMELDDAEEIEPSMMPPPVDDDDAASVISDDEEEVRTEAIPDQSRYNLRTKNRFYGHRDGDWRERKIEYAFRLGVKEAIRRLGRDATFESIHRELMSIHKKGVVEPVYYKDIPSSKRKMIIRSFMFLREKYNSAGEYEKLKSRLVGMGNLQDKTIYSESEIAAPTAAISSIYMIANIAATEGRKVMTADIGTAYLNSDMKKEVYMLIEPEYAKLLANEVPEYGPFIGSDGKLYVRLRKALYGCVESAKLWFNTISTKLLSLGFTANCKDECVFNKVNTRGNQVTVCVYVDDLLMTCVDESSLQELIEELRKEYKDVTAHEGPVHSYLGQTFDFSDPGKVRLTMAKYILDMLDLYDVRGDAATPATATLFVVDEKSAQLSPEMKERFHSRVAKILYLAKRVRPDLLMTVIFLATRVKDPREEDWTKLERLLRYINSTRDIGMVLEASHGLQILAYVDASFGVHGDYKSHTGAMISLGAGPIWAKSSKQKINSKSSTEAELIGLSDAVSQVIWTRDFLIAQGHAMEPATVFQDNLSTISLATNGSAKAERTRHIAIRFFFIKDRIEAKELTLKHLGTDEMISDMLTKPLQGDKFRVLRRLLLNWDVV